MATFILFSIGSFIINGCYNDKRPQAKTASSIVSQNNNNRIATDINGVLILTTNADGRIQHHIDYTKTPTWIPKIGDRVQTINGYPDAERPIITTITNVVNVGKRTGSGMLVYGEGLPGVDRWWVTPAL